MEALRNLGTHQTNSPERQGYICVVDAGGGIVADVYFDEFAEFPITRDQALDLARKASAAPEMFDALSALIEGALVVLIDGSDEIRAALASGKAALAKARGDQGWVPLAVPAAELVAALDKLRARFHSAVVASGSDREFADAACADVDALLARARGEGR